LLDLVWEDGIWSGHVLQWSFAWPLPWLLSYCRFSWPNAPDIFTHHRNPVPDGFLRWLSIVALALALHALYHYLLPTSTLSIPWFAFHTMPSETLQECLRIPSQIINWSWFWFCEPPHR
jgi:hypothetical protein